MYNTVTGGIVQIQGDEDLYKSLDSLIEMRYYVTYDIDEYQWINELRSTKKNQKPNRGINGYTILTSTDCNARCFYCFEKGQKRTSMTESVAHDVSNYIEKESQDSPVNIRWFGGEPLINTKAIDIICNNLTLKGIEFKSTMVSNGLLFSDSIINKAKKIWKLKSVQITLDGTKDVYQKAKSYRGATGNEFEKVISNIRKLIDSDIRVSIRLNQDSYNTNDLVALVDFLAKKFLGEKNISLYNSLLYEENLYTNPELEKEKYNEFLQLQERIINSGLFRKNTLKGKLRVKHCMADNDSSIIITPNGNIGKCEHYTDQHIIGNIYNSELDKTETEKWKETYQPNPKCLNCPLYPHCVRIKMCPVEKEACSLTQCENKIYLIKRALLKKLKESNESDSY